MDLNALDIAILIFIFLETMNVIILYHKPWFKYGNSMFSFKTWERLKTDEESILFLRYLVNWVANSKVIFIMLLSVMLFTAEDITKLWSVIILAVTTCVYFLKLHPIVKKLDAMNVVQPKGYSKTLFRMISGIIAMFVVAVIVFLHNNVIA